MLNPTAYPQINQALDKYLDALQSEFGDELLSVYALGSLSTHSYVHGWSDVNGVVIVKQGDQVHARAQAARQAVLAAHPEWRDWLFACCIPAGALKNVAWQNHPPGWGLVNLTNLVEDGLLIWGQELEELERPTLEALRAYLIWELINVLEVSPTEASLFWEKTYSRGLPLRAPQGGEWDYYGQHSTQVVDWLVYPTRVLLTWDKGRVGSKTEAVNHYIEEYHGPYEPVLLQADTLRRTGPLDTLTPETLATFAGQAPGLFEWMVKRLLSILFLPVRLEDAAHNLRRWLEHDPTLPPARPGQTYEILIPDRKPWLKKT